MKERDLSIDYAKGLAIILVYMSHSILYYPPGLFANSSWSDYLGKMIVSCNMPLFFLISGLLFAYSKKTTLDIVKDKVRRLMIPYLFTMMLVVIAKQFLPANMSAYHASGGVIDWILTIFVYGGERWFVYVLIWIFILSLPIRKLKSSKWMLMIIAITLSLTLMIQLPELFLMNKVVWYLSFFLLGMFLNQFYIEFKEWNTKYAIFVSIVFLMLNIVFVLDLMQIPIFKKAILPVTGTVFFMTLAYLIDKYCKSRGGQTAIIKYIAYCGRYSLQFYLFTFAYPVIRYVVVNLMHIVNPLVIFTLVLILQFIVMTLIVEITRRIKILKIPMGY